MNTVLYWNTNYLFSLIKFVFKTMHFISFKQHQNMRVSIPTQECFKSLKGRL